MLSPGCVMKSLNVSVLELPEKLVHWSCEDTIQTVLAQRAHTPVGVGEHCLLGFLPTWPWPRPHSCLHTDVISDMAGNQPSSASEM